MEASDKETRETAGWDRLRKSWFPAAAVMGAFAAFVAAAFRIRPTPNVTVPPATPPDAAGHATLAILPAPKLARQYAMTAILGGAESARPFRRSLAGVAVGADDAIYALGDDEVRIFAADARFLRSWKVAERAACLAVAPGGQVCIGVSDRVEIFDAGGKAAGGFPAGEKDWPAEITAIRMLGREILVADAAARIIRRYDEAAGSSASSEPRARPAVSSCRTRASISTSTPRG